MNTDYCGICKETFVLPSPGCREGRCARHSVKNPDEPMLGLTKDQWMCLPLAQRAEGHLQLAEFEKAYDKLFRSEANKAAMIEKIRRMRQ